MLAVLDPSSKNKYPANLPNIIFYATAEPVQAFQELHKGLMIKITVSLGRTPCNVAYTYIYIYIRIYLIDAASQD